MLTVTNKAFWDVNLAALNEEEHSDFIIARVFQYGDVDDIRAILRVYQPHQIKHAIENTRGIMDSKSLALATIFAK
ncbi:MAG: hypothetical protein JNK66_05990 [Chitinophagales bacterium]|nr:hypothetical protein [Chitinophagales bacterium]